jgi:translation elongation factor EF-4
MPEEEPAVPIEPAVAAARTRYVKAKIEIVKALKGDGMTQAEAQEHADVKDFAEKYPALFKMLFKIDINNEASLRTMLAMLERMGTGDMSQDQASTVVGQRLYDTFIKSKIGEDVPR